LRAFGCDIVQGYYFSRPLAEADLFARIREIGKSTETQVA
jgi:EAL domain-containing protein (putative c-di-GMP-specific phosphodiesterase class I)